MSTVIHLWTPITKGKRGWGKGKRERERDGQETPKWNEKHFCPFDSLLLCHTEITFFAVKSVVAVEKREREKKKHNSLNYINDAFSPSLSLPLSSPSPVQLKPKNGPVKKRRTETEANTRFQSICKRTQTPTAEKGIFRITEVQQWSESK